MPFGSRDQPAPPFHSLGPDSFDRVRATKFPSLTQRYRNDRAAEASFALNCSRARGGFWTSPSLSQRLERLLGAGGLAGLGVA